MSFFAIVPSRSSALPRRCLLVAGLAAALACASGGLAAQQDFGQTPPASGANAYPPPQGNAYPTQPGNGSPAQPANGYPPPQGNAYPAQGQPQGFPSSSGNPPPSMPAQGGTSQGGNPGMPAQGNPLQQLLQAELQDYGVPPQQTLQANLHGPTPTRIPGGETITTDRVIGLIQQNLQGQQAALVFHVLGPGPRLPGAENAAPASQAGSFNDATQQEFARYLQQVTGGDKAKPMLFYCQNTQCWMSYNAALRAIAMGHTRVYWYRGGIEAWQQAESLAMSMQPQAPSTQQPMQPQAMPAGYR